jgi:hypothetical protein
MPRYYIRLPDPTVARGEEPSLSFQALGAAAFADELSDALRHHTLFERWRAQQEAPNEIDPELGAVDPLAEVVAAQSHLAIDLEVSTTLSSNLLRQRLRWLAGSNWQLRDVAAD